MTLSQALARHFDRASRDLRMNRVAARFTNSTAKSRRYETRVQLAAAPQRYAGEAGETSLARGVFCRTFGFCESGGKPPRSKMGCALLELRCSLATFRLSVYRCCYANWGADRFRGC